MALAQVRSFFADPLFAWLAIAFYSIVTGVTGKFEANMISMGLMILIHIACRMVETMAEQRYELLHTRATSRLEPVECKICHEKPHVVYLENADIFYVRCNNCSTQTEMKDTAEEVIGDWNFRMSNAHQEAGPE